MKNPISILKWTLAVAAVLLMTLCANAQTTNQVPNYVPPANWAELAIQEFETSTNFVVFGGYGHTIQGTGKNLVFAEVGYNFNNYAGVVAGYDYLWGAHKHQFNSLAGGLALQAPLHLFGSTNVVIAPTIFDQVATSQSSTVANIVGAGLDFRYNITPAIFLHAGFDYEKRTGDAIWDGEYGLVHAGLSGSFW